MAQQPGYTTIGLPEGMIQEVDRVIADPRYGYTSRAEFIKEAVRRHLSQMNAAATPREEHRRRSADVDLDDQGLPRAKFRP